MAWRPSKWITGSPVALLPFVAAFWFNTTPVQDDIAARAMASLTAAGGSWAKLSVSGRDVILTGDAPSDDAVSAAAKAVAGTYGVRLVQTAVHVLPPLPAPTVDKVEGPAKALVATGTWPDGQATKLQATLGDKSWTLGTDADFTSAGAGKWQLKLPADLHPGTYDLQVTASDAAGRVAADASKDEITVVAPVVKPPTVESLDSNSSTPEIKGTWPSEDAKTLTVTVGPTPYVLGSAAELTTTGGAWTLKPSKPLADGTYDVTVEASDGTTTYKGAAPGHLLIDTTPPAQPEVSPVTVTGQPFTVTGKWAEGDAVSLVAKLADRAWTLGQDKALASDGKGNWSLTPDMVLQPGTYDLGVETKDRLGNASVLNAKGAVVIRELPPMPAPSVKSVESNSATPDITGTWPSGLAKALTVTLGPTPYVLGQNAELTAAGDNWTLKPSKPLADGTYDVSVEASDGVRSVVLQEPGHVLVDTVAPAAPVVTSGKVTSQPFTITGTWPEGDAVSLIAKIGDKIWQLGQSPALVSAGKGIWSLTPDVTFAPGTYDLTLEARDKVGNASSATAAGAIVLEAPKPPEALRAPTVTAYAGETSPAAVTGTWDEANAAALSVAIPGAKVAATLGAGSALTSDGKGNWTLALAAPLTPGIYDVAVVETAKDGRTASDTSTAELYVKAPPPPPPPPPPPLVAPSVASYSGETSPAMITGTWDEGNASGLVAGIPSIGFTATLGTDKALVTDGKGHWALMPPALKTGTYDVTVVETAGDGRSAADASKDEVTVREAAPPPPPPKPLAAPVIAVYAGEASPASITGTWDEGNADSLVVGIPAIGLSAKLGADAVLTSDGKGNWALALPALKPGVYDVSAVETAKDGRSASDNSTAEIYIKAPPPPPPPPPPAPLVAPAVASYTGESSPAMITGTWDEANAQALVVGIPAIGLSATLGTDKTLATDGNGHWSLVPPALKPGTYDVTVVETAGDGRSAADASKDEVTVKEPAAPPPPAFDCGPPLADLQAEPIQFGFDQVVIEPPHDVTVRNIAELLNDPRCKDVNVQVAGRADFYGDRRYNIALSIRRAQAVVDALAAAGVDPSRLSVDGLGKDEPLDPKRSDVARARNRSVIVTIAK